MIYVSIAMALGPEVLPDELGSEVFEGQVLDVGAQAARLARPLRARDKDGTSKGAGGALLLLEGVSGLFVVSSCLVSRLSPRRRRKMYMLTSKRASPCRQGSHPHPRAHTHTRHK
jgi:hypothetical protein